MQPFFHFFLWTFFIKNIICLFELFYINCIIHVGKNSFKEKHNIIERKYFLLTDVNKKRTFC